jgi:CRISPR-associated protein Cas1
MRRSENTVELELSEGGKRDIPVNDIRSIHLLGEVDLNTRILVFLNQRGIPLHVYNWYGYYSGSFYPREKLLSGFLTVKQVEHYLDREKRLTLAKEFVRTAIHNVVQNLNHYKDNGKDVNYFIEGIRREEEALEDADSITNVMGVEGKAREVYYSSFETILREGFEFEKRTKRPPENMLNCMISFGNSLMYASTLSEIYHTQLTPTVSYLHEPGERRYSLALDLSEVFKPIIVDRVIFNLVNNRIIKDEHFLQELNSCYLNESGRRVFVEEYDKKLKTTLRHTVLKRSVSYQRLIRIEAYKLVRHLLGEKQYRGFRSKW